MTTVAFKQGSMACDSCWNCGGTVDFLATKIVRLSSGGLLGMAGQADGRAVQALVDKVKTPGQLPSYEAIGAVRAEVTGLLVLPKGRVFKIATSMIAPGNADADFGVWEITAPFAAIGSGGEHALIAMDCGKSARDAVRIACKYDTRSRAPVHVIDLAMKART